MFIWEFYLGFCMLFVVLGIGLFTYIYVDLCLGSFLGVKGLGFFF